MAGGCELISVLRRPASHTLLCHEGAKGLGSFPPHVALSWSHSLSSAPGVVTVSFCCLQLVSSCPHTTGNVAMVDG